MSAYMNLLGVVEDGKNGYQTLYLEERGRGYASDLESWAEIKKQLELLATGQKDAEKLQKELWEAAKEENTDAFAAYLGQLERSAKQLAAEWVRTAAMAEIALGG